MEEIIIDSEKYLVNAIVKDYINELETDIQTLRITTNIGVRGKNKPFGQLLRDVIVITAWIVFMGTLAYSSVGQMPSSSRPFEWWIFPVIVFVAAAPIFMGWKLRKDYEKYNQID